MQFPKSDREILSPHPKFKESPIENNPTLVNNECTYLYTVNKPLLS